MKKFKTLFIVFAGLVGLVVIAAAMLPLFFKDAIAARVKAEVNKSVNATVNFSGFGLTFLTSFPSLTLSVEDLSVVGIEEFAGQRLASAKSFNLTLSLWNLIGGNTTTTTSVTLDRPDVHIVVLKDGKANYDIAKPAAPESEPSSFSLALQSYAIRNAAVSYEDRSSGLRMALENLNHRGTGDFTSDVFTLVTTTTADRWNMWYAGVKYLSGVRATLDSNLRMDLPRATFTVKDSLLTLNELGLGVDGWVAMPGKDIDVDLKWSVKKNDFKNFLSLVPGVYREGFRDVSAQGAVALNGFAKGTFTDTRRPGFGLTVSVENGSFRYPSLPAAVTNVNVDLSIANPDGVPDHTVVDLKRLHAELGGEPIDARLHLATPVSDPRIDAMAKGTINLDRVKSYIPLEQGTDLGGVVTADVTMKGRYASVANRQADQLHAAGTLAFANVSFKGEGVPSTVIRRMRLTFSPANATLSDFDATAGKSQITASGSLDNLPAYYFKNEMLRGRLSVASSLLDLNEFMTRTPAAGVSTGAAPASQPGAIALPANLDLAAQASIARVLYENLTLENVKGAVRLKDQVLDMTGLTFNMLDGAVTMSGQYGTSNPSRPQFNYNLTLAGLDIQRTATAFDTVRTLAPIAQRAKGTFASELTVRGEMDENNQPIHGTINGRGKLTTQDVSIANFEPLNKIADALHMGDFKDIPIQRTVIQFAITNGRVAVDPFETTLHGTSARVSGSSGLDQTLDYTVNLAIPRSKIGDAALGTFSGLLGKVGSLTGGAVQLPDPFKVDLLVGGTVPTPTVKLALAGNGGGVGGALIDQAKSQLQDAAKQKLQEVVKGKLQDQLPGGISNTLDQANERERAAAEAAKLLAEAESQAQQLRDAARASAERIKQEGYAAADRLVAQAGNPIARLAAQRAADQVRKQTDQQAQKLIDDGNTTASALVETARKKGGG